MADSSAHIHPRKLYEALRACPSPETRRQAAFEFLRGRTGSSQAFLFTVNAGELMLVESSPDCAQVPGLVEEAKRAWTSEQDSTSDDDRTKTVDIRTMEALQRPAASLLWQSPSGTRFDRTFLSLYRDGAWVSVGLFMWKPSELAAPTPIRRAHVEALCNAFIDAGDVAVPKIAPTAAMP
jgi:hypothetical protein